MTQEQPRGLWDQESKGEERDKRGGREGRVRQKRKIKRKHGDLAVKQGSRQGRVCLEGEEERGKGAREKELLKRSGECDGQVRGIAAQVYPEL